MFHLHLNFYSSFGKLKKLKTLRLSENKIEIIPESLGGSDLSKSLKNLWMDRNKLLRLSESFGEFKALDNCKFDLNPLRSPPVEIFQIGVTRLIDYCKVRNNHIFYLKSNLPSVLKNIVRKLKSFFSWILN